MAAPSGLWAEQPIVEKSGSALWDFAHMFWYMIAFLHLHRVPEGVDTMIGHSDNRQD
jgi:hypothetical protein